MNIYECLIHYDDGDGCDDGDDDGDGDVKYGKGV